LKDSADDADMNTSEKESNMAATSMMFGEIETSTNRALAYAILASQAAHAYITAIYSSRELANALGALIKVLTPENLARLTEDQKKWLTPRLQEIHGHLVTSSRSSEAARLSRLPILGSLVTRIQDETEDLDDVIEDMVLANDPDFRNLIMACERNLNVPEGELVARMQG
jgi:hypothetical protein